MDLCWVKQLYTPLPCMFCVCICLCSSFMVQEFFNYQSNHHLSAIFLILNTLFINGNMKGHAHTTSVCCVNVVNSLFYLTFETLNLKIHLKLVLFLYLREILGMKNVSGLSGWMHLAPVSAHPAQPTTCLLQG